MPDQPPIGVEGGVGMTMGTIGHDAMAGSGIAEGKRRGTYLPSGCYGIKRVP